MNEVRDQGLGCAEVDELDAAYVLGAVDPIEAQRVTEHLSSCREPHAELRALLGSGDVLAMSLAPVEAGPHLRARLMSTIAATRQEHVGAVERSAAPMTEPRRGWLGWLSPGLARGLAAAAVVFAIAVGAWNVSLQSRLSDAERVTAAVASATAAHAVSGDAGRGLVLETNDGAVFVASALKALPANRIYELWLLDEAGAPRPVGTLTSAPSDPTLVPLDQDLSGFATFAVTVERSRVEAPTGAPVMSGSVTG